MKKLSWTDLKLFLADRSASVHYIDFSNHYHVIAIDGPLQFCCEIGKVDPVQEGSPQKDFEDNYKDSCNKPMQDFDMTGRSIVRYAATKKGWHYQAHSVEFSVNVKGSIYNSDRDGVDLGYATMKFYDAQGNELTNQNDIDNDGVKTVVKWAPTFDYEIISGNIRQLSQETVDSRIYVDAMIPTGLPAPNDWLRVPFAEGGINLKYIGADEILKTDGRASKLVQGTLGAYFEITCNYDKNTILSTANHHAMSIIFEIYKDPTS